jgi:GMP synthase (glutamine-hydrolysing)
MIHVIDFGSSKVPHITGMIQSLGHDTMIQRWNHVDQVAIQSADAIVLSGSPVFLTKVDHTPYLEQCSFLKNLDIPVLGICFGHQVLGILHDSEIYRGEEVRKSIAIRLLQPDPLFEGLGTVTHMTEDHTEGILLPDKFIHLASSELYPNEGMRHPYRKIWGIQFHPEVSGEKGLQVFSNFLQLV